jgi:hypothetical protein
MMVSKDEKKSVTALEFKQRAYDRLIAVLDEDNELTEDADDVLFQICDLLALDVEGLAEGQKLVVLFSAAFAAFGKADDV